MRFLLYVAAALALALLATPDALEAALATAASTLFEATPFLLGGILLTRVAGRYGECVAYLGCGCGAGPSARSLPAAAAAWLLFGPATAIARFAVAVAISRLLAARATACSQAHAAHATPSLLSELSAMLPAAAIAAVTVQLAALLDLSRAPLPAAIAAGALLGFAAPCGLGAIAIAGALHARAPAAATAYLCVAGIYDLRAWGWLRPKPTQDQDALAYVLLAIALALVAFRHGDALVHPAIALLLGACAIFAVASLFVHRRKQRSVARVAPALMLIGALLSAPPPAYRATETTLSDLFAGERLSFTGRLVDDGNKAALVRYAITCCRADAAPVVVRLARSLPMSAGTWVRAEGAVVASGTDLRLQPSTVTPIVPPSDPFIYR